MSFFDEVPDIEHAAARFSAKEAVVGGYGKPDPLVHAITMV
jgi:phosphopantetheinyl transferase (holo-ACP synthase)